MKRRLFLAVGACAMIGSVAGSVVHVEATASAAGDGSAAHPYRTPAAALEGVRRDRAAGRIDAADSVLVLIGPGDYRLDAPLAFGRTDGGASESCPVIWRATAPGKTRFVGATRLPKEAFGPVSDKAMRARLPAGVRDRVRCADVSRFFPDGRIPEEKAYFRGVPSAPVLFFNGGIAPLARWPNDGYATFEKSVAAGDNFNQTGLRGKCGAFVFDNPRVAKWNLKDGVWLAGFWTHDWDFGTARVASWGKEGGTAAVMRLATPVCYGVGLHAWGGLKGRRFYAMNVLEELDAPGEWYLDRRAKKVYLLPNAGGLGAKDEVFFAARGTPLVTVKGASNLRFENLVFTYGAGKAFEVTGTGIRFTGCTFRSLAGDGIGTLAGDSNRITRCHAQSIAGRVFDVSGGDRATLRRAETRVEGCVIEDFGLCRKTYSEAVEVNGCGVTVRDCLIRRGPHTAIRLHGNEHLVEYCEIAHVLAETLDAGAIYTGRDWTSQGSVIRRNFIHHVGGLETFVGREKGGTIGVYLDDTDCGDVVDENIFWKVCTGIALGGGRDHPIRNNVFADCNFGVSFDCRGWRDANSYLKARPGTDADVCGKCRAMRHTEGVWACRYPHLAGQFEDQMFAPLYNPIEHNVFLDCPWPVDQAMHASYYTNFMDRLYFHDNVAFYSGTNAPWATHYGSAEKRQAFRVGKTAPDDLGFADPGSGDFRLKACAALFREMPAFVPPPFDRMCKDRPAFPGEELLRIDFEDAAMKGFRLPGTVWKNEAGVGCNGSRALVWRRRGTNEVARSARLPLPFVKPGMMIEVEARVKLIDCPDGSNPNINLQWSDRKIGGCSGVSCRDRLVPPNTKFGRAHFKRPARDAEGWVPVHVIMKSPLPPNATVPELYFGVENADRGHVIFDEAVVRLRGVKYVLAMASSVYRDEAFDGSVTFAVRLGCAPGTGARATFAYASAAGSVKTVSADELDERTAKVTLPVAALATGAHPVRFRLAAADGRELGRASLAFTRHATPVVRKVHFDRFGRTVVNGKLFFPLGMYWHENNFKKHPELLDHYASGPFNCLQTYDSYVTTAELDAYWKKGLYVMPSVHQYYMNELHEWSIHPVKGIASRADEARVLAEYVNALKDHPAFLAWYTCSEMSAAWHARFKAHADLIRQLDPDHPHFAAFYEMDAITATIDCYDALGRDVYSVRAPYQTKARFAPDRADVWSSTKSVFRIRELTLGCRAIWQIPQAFAWKWDYPERPECDFPTAKEYRSMCWQHIAAGANGLFMYAYGQMVDHEWGTPLFERDWKTVTAAAAEVKSQIPVLLKEPGPVPASVPDRTLVRTWRDDAAVYALVCNTHPERRTGVVVLPDVGGTCDTLLGDGVYLRDRKLELDLEPFGVALVRLRR